MKKQIPLATLALFLVISFFSIFKNVQKKETQIKIAKYVEVNVEKIKKGQIWRLILSLLFHDDWSHLGVNLLEFLITSVYMEWTIGWIWVIIVFFFTGTFGVFVDSLVALYINKQQSHLIGASCAINGLYGGSVAHVLLMWEHTTLMQKLIVGTFVIFQIGNVIAELALDNDAQVFWCHISGFILGFVCIFGFFKHPKIKIRFLTRFLISILILSVLIISGVISFVNI